MGIKTLFRNICKRLSFPGSGDYWERNYAGGGTSGEGSYGVLAQFKAEFLNKLVVDEAITSIIEFGCGDGNQLSLAAYPHYIGIDVSKTAVQLCTSRFLSDPTKVFLTLADYNGQKADCALSLDVIYHLVEDAVFDDYMDRLFAAAERYVIVYSTNHNETYGPGVHVRHRNFTSWVSQHAKQWNLLDRIANPHKPQAPDSDRSASSSAEFYIYQRV